MPRTLRTTPRLLRRFFNGSTLFNGTTSVIDCGSEIVGAGDVTVSAWIRLISFGEGSAGRILDNGKFRIATTGSSKFIEVSSDYSTNASTSANSIVMNRWIHLTVTRKATGVVNIYLNGILSGTANQSSGTPAAGTNNLLIGSNSSGSRNGSGRIAEVCIVKRIVTEAERYAIMNGSFPSDATNLWKLDDQPSTYIDTIGGATGTGTATVYSPDVPVQQRVLRGGDLASIFFDGTTSGQQISIDSANIETALADAPAMTVHMRVLFFKKTGAGTYLIGKRYASSPYFCYRLIISNSTGAITFTHLNNSDVSASASSSDCSGRWVDISAVHDGSFVYLYIDGKLVAKTAQTGTLKNNDNQHRIGSLDGSGASFLGYLKSARIWNVALTHEQIKKLYFDKIVPTNGLVANYVVNEGAGTVIYDSSGNGNNGAMHSSLLWSSNVPSKARVTHPIGRTLHT